MSRLGFRLYLGIMLITMTLACGGGEEPVGLPDADIYAEDGGFSDVPGDSEADADAGDQDQDVGDVDDGDIGERDGEVEDPTASHIQFTPEFLSIEEGESRSISVAVIDTNGDPMPVSVTVVSADPQIAAISADGSVEGIQSGQTSLNASYEDLTAELPVVVGETPILIESIEILAASTSVDVDDTLALEAVVWADDGTQIDGISVSWESAQEDVALVSDQGLVTGVSGGTATITAEAAGVSDEIAIDVQEISNANQEQYLTISPGEKVVAIGEIITFEATFFDGDSSSPVTPDWSTADSDRATVDASGVVTGVGTGTTTLTASHEGSEIQAVVHVLPFFESVHSALIPTGTHIGRGHSCALTPDSEAYCWGLNSSGQVGDGTTEDRDVPQPVSGDLDFTQLVVGSSHSCGLTTSGEAYCWGDNENLQLGVDTLDHSADPVEVSGDYLFTQLTTSHQHTCGITDSDQAVCWGRNSHGQLGNGGTTNFDSIELPQVVEGDLDWSVVDTGSLHTCGITVDGDGYCWGFKQLGRLGFDTIGIGQSTPAAIDTTDSLVEISAGTDFTCAINTDDEVLCWGANSYGQLGDSSTNGRWQPETVNLPAAATSLQTTYRAACADLVNSTYCWGENPVGALGIFESHATTTPMETSMSLDYQQWSLSSNRSCGVRSDGVIECWGVRRASGPTIPEVLYAPVQVTPWSGINLAMLRRALCIDDGINQGRCFGNQWAGNLGFGGSTATGTLTQWLPRPLDIGDRLEEIQGGNTMACAWNQDRDLYCWGSNYHGQLGVGDETTRSSPTAVDTALTFEKISLGESHSCGITDEEEGYCWGRNYGLLGTGEWTSNELTPQAIATAASLVHLSVGWEHSCAVTTNGDGLCWGDNTGSFGGPGDGRLGDGSSSDRGEPTPISGDHQFSLIEAGSFHTCGLTETGELLCWGSNHHGQLATGDDTDSLVPVSSTTDMTFTDLAMGFEHSCALNQQGHAFCWGKNEDGQLGTGDQIDRWMPSPVIGGLQFESIHAYGRRTCAVSAEGIGYCWGTDTHSSVQSTVMPRELRAGVPE